MPLLAQWDAATVTISCLFCLGGGETLKENPDTAQKLLQRGRRDAAVHPAWRAQAQDGVRAGFSTDGSLPFKLKMMTEKQEL